MYTPFKCSMLIYAEFAFGYHVKYDYNQMLHITIEIRLNAHEHDIYRQIYTWIPWNPFTSRTSIQRHIYLPPDICTQLIYVNPDL